MQLRKQQKANFKIYKMHNMNMFITGIIVINFVCVCITDCTDAPKLLKKLLVYMLSKGKLYTDKYECKLLECSLCQTFHLSNIWLLAYSLCLGQFNMLFLCIPITSALFTTHTYQLIQLANDIVDTLINIMSKLIKFINEL